MKKLFLQIFLKIFEKMLCHILSKGDLTIYSEDKKVCASHKRSMKSWNSVEIWNSHDDNVSTKDIKCSWKVRR